MPGRRMAGRLKTTSVGRLFKLVLVVASWLILPACSVLITKDSGLPRMPADLSAYPWLYLRDGDIPREDEQVVELLAVGDIMLGRGVLDQDNPFGSTRQWLQSADLAIGNFEGAMLPVKMHFDPPVGNPDPAIHLLVPATAAQTLQEAGFDLLGLANNHAADTGEHGVLETVAQLDQAGVRTFGADFMTGPQVPPYSQRINDVDLALLAFNMVPIPSGEGMPVWSAEEAAEAIQAAHQKADVVIVSVHWGYEYQLQPAPAQREIARIMVAAGADLVIGHHPHVVQSTQIFPLDDQPTDNKASFVAYSLGNFVFDQYEDETSTGLVLRALIDQSGLRGVQALPVWAGPRPRWMTPAEADALKERLIPPARQLGFHCNDQTCYPIAEPKTRARSGYFASGEIDLTGDGIPEQVSLQDSRVTIQQDGLQAWQSPPEWRVLDLALGDPNDDGRGELILALRKPDSEGVLRSHPFIVGYRSGTYRLLWGGSAVADPIIEIELGDVDGDQVQELIVLEDRDQGASLSVWRWHGWGFSLFWRGPSGHYHDLVLVPAADSKQLTITIAADWHTE